MKRSTRTRYTHFRVVLVCIVALAAGMTGDALAEDTPEIITLERALELASEDSEEILINAEQLNQALLDRDRAWSTILPSLSFSGTYTHSDREIAFNDRVLQRQDSLEGRLSATMTLFRAGAQAHIVVATHATHAAQATARWTEAQLLFEVARAFYAALAARQLVEAARRTVTTAEEHLTAMEARRSVGEVLAIDEGRARLALVEAEEELRRAQNVSDGAVDALALLIGREPPLLLPDSPQPILDTGDSQNAPQLLGAGNPQEALDRRADLSAATFEVRAAQSAVTESWLDYLPTVSLTGSYHMTQNTGFSGDPFSWQLVMTLDWVLYDGGYRRATRRERASQRRETQLRLQQLDRTARHQLRQARRDLDTAIATLQTTEQRRELASETRNQVLRLYRAGISNSLELVEADDALGQAEIALVSRQLSVALARLDLLQAFGLDPLGRE